MVRAGFSTGCLYKTNLPLIDRIKLFYSAGADAIELSFSSLPELIAFRLEPYLVSSLSKFSHVSVHAPWYMCYGTDYYTIISLRKLSEIYNEIHPSGIVIHPDTIEEYSRLRDFGLPFLFENMDPRKDFGKFPSDFETLKKEHNYGFVLDIFHTYENDQSLADSKKFIEVMENRLSHLHVSGINGNLRHAPSYNSDNVQPITEILKIVNGITRISEGTITSNIEDNLFQELRFLKSL